MKNKASSMKAHITGLKVDIVNIPAATHSPQDWVDTLAFEASDGATVWTGAVSDGCSSAPLSARGAAWQTEHFCLAAQASYDSGLRGKHLAWDTIRQFLDAFAKEAEELRDETKDCLVATLLGIIVDHDSVVLTIIGSGTFEMNGECCEIQQSGGDIYPIHILAHPDIYSTNVRHLAEDAFRILVLPTDGVQSMAICTDGMDLENLARLTSAIQAPEQLARQVVLESKSKFRMGPGGERAFRFTEDDTAAIFLRNYSARAPLADSRLLYDLCHAYSRVNASKFLHKRYAENIHEAPVVVDFHAKPSGGPPVDMDVLARLGVHRHVLPTIPDARYIPLTQLCRYRWATRPYERSESDPYYRPRVCSRRSDWMVYSFGLRTCLVVLYELASVIKSLHSEGVLIGNVRPSDVYVKLEFISSESATKLAHPAPPAYYYAPITSENYLNVDVRLNNPQAWAIERPDVGISRGYGEIDEKRIHPKLLKGFLAGDSDHRVRHEWMSFAALGIHLLTKADPFLEGEPRHAEMAASKERWSRMSAGLAYWNVDHVDTNPFYITGLNRLSPGLRDDLVIGAQAMGRLVFDQEQLIDCFKQLKRCSKCHLQQHIEHLQCQNTFCNAEL